MKLRERLAKARWLIYVWILVKVMVGAAIFLSCTEAPAVAVGARAPDFSAIDIARGSPVSLSNEYHGQVTLVNVWATWCGPCRKEIPSLQALYRELGPKGLKIAAISVDTVESKEVAEFMKGFGVTFDVLHDRERKIELTYGSKMFPESFLIDRKGQIVRIDYGARVWTTEDVIKLVSGLLTTAGELKRATMRRQWLMIASILSGIALGTWGLTRYAPPPEGTRYGQLLPAFHTWDPVHSDSLEVRDRYRGHVTLINLWATWCGPCLVEMPSIEKLYEKYQSRGFRVAAISLDDSDSQSVMEFVKQRGLSFDIYQDRSSRSQQLYGGIGLPHSIIIDEKGKVRYLTTGKEQWDSPESFARIEALLGTQP